MTTAIQFNVTDAVTDEYILPSTLATGLKALYFFDRGLIRSLTNLAPGGVQGASFFGAPTINADGTMTFANGTTYMQTPIIQGFELTILTVVYSNAPLVGELSQICSNLSADRSPPVNAGLVINNVTASTAPDGKLSMTSRWGNPTDDPTTSVNLGTSLDIPQWRTPSLIYATAGSTEEVAVLGSQTLGTSAHSATQTLPLFPNLSVPFRLGSAAPGGTTTGNVNMAMWAYYNRVLTSGERVAFQSWISARLQRKYSYSV